MKIAVSSYSFTKLFDRGELTQLDCIAKAKEMGFDAVEFSGVRPPEGMTAEDYARRLQEECARLEMPVSNYAVGADFLTGSQGDLEAEIARVCGEVDMAARLGATCMRHDATYGVPDEQRATIGFDQVLPRLAEGCRRVTEYAASRGIVTTVENHGFFCQDSRRVEKLVCAVGHPNFGLLGDMGNFLCADEAPAVAYGRIAPYVKYAHAKDFLVKDGQGANPGDGFFCSRGGCYLRGTVIGHGVVPVKQCLSILKKSGYDGYVSVEFEGWEETEQAIRAGLENLRRYLAELE
ncbi:MAG: sugar phosphate isomerase/epimerase [Clostridia bacterium]|nr:sugar phosphate isomerase/epimerase [Clostridia bacterium]